ncbi:MAG: serine/threonine-protein kinase, partial [Gaiellaceae bacterium]
AGEDDGRPFLVMEYVPGETLAARLGRDGTLPPRRVLSLGADLAGALAHIHELGMVHRDVKPENVFLTPDGTVKLGDFGIARALTQPRMTEIGTVLGTASYLAPELLTGGDATPPSDVFALGVLLYESASGELPRRGATVDDLSAADSLPLSLAAPDAPAELVRVVERCLARDPAARPAAAELAQELLPAQAGAASRPAPVRPTRPLPAAPRAVQQSEGQWGRPSLYRHRRRWLLAGAGLALALVAVAIALAVTLGGGSPPGQGSVTLAPPAAGENPSLQARNLAAWLLEHADAGSP